MDWFQLTPRFDFGNQVLKRSSSSLKGMLQVPAPGIADIRVLLWP